LILGADPDRYSSMIRGLKNASLAGRDEWPKECDRGLEGDEPNGRHERDYEGNSFLNDQDKEHKKEYPTVAQPWHAGMTCRKCLQKGHIARLPTERSESSSNRNMASTTTICVWPDRDTGPQVGMDRQSYSIL
jgi:hypothetical protein